MAIFTFFLAVASIFTDVGIYLQWQASLAVQKDTREQLKAIVVQSGVSVFPQSLKDGNPSAYGFIFSFRNIGGTRTNSFSAWVSIHYFPGQVPDNLDYTKPYRKVDTNYTIVPPNETIPLPPISLTADEVDLVQKHSGVAAVWGHAEWSDIFNPAVIHVINFCVSALPLPNLNGAVVFRPVPIKSDCNTNT